MVTIRKHTLDEFWAYLRGQQMYRAPLATFLHHTWVPNASQYHGLSSIETIRRYHLSKGWSDIAANAYTAPDGSVYNGRNLRAGNWCHAHVSRSWADVMKRNRKLYNLCNGYRGWPNKYAFGIETIGNFDSEDPKTSRAMATSLDVLAMVHKLWEIPVECCFAHRDVANKTCPGSKVSMGWVRQELAARLSGQVTPIKIVLHGTSPPVIAATALVVPRGNHIDDDGKLYVSALHVPDSTGGET